MKKLFLNIAAAVITVLSLVGISSLAPEAYAVRCPNGDEKDNISLCYENVEGADRDLTSTLNVIINVVIGIVGFIAVVMMIMGGISFVTSQGDTAKVTKARNTILYGVVGLVVALLAFAIVNFVLASVFRADGTGIWI